MNLFRARLADGARLEVDGFVVRLSVSRRARRISLRIDPVRREAIAVAPTERGLSEALAFVRERRAWVAERLAAIPGDANLAAQDEITIFGERCALNPNGRRARLVRTSPDVPPMLIGCGDGEVDPLLVARAIKREALAVFKARATIHCRGLGVAPPSIAIADARTRWGSCSSARPGRPASIRLSWRLALAPFDVADYVVAHECAHIVEANHGPRFWAQVRRLVGDPAPHRAWLRANGASLQASIG
jgi:predicted metal-dependent hydrolase